VEGESWRGFTIGNTLTRSTRDSAALLDAIQGADVGAPYEIKPPARPYRDEIGAPPGKLRIAFTVSPMLTDAVHPDCVAGVQATAKLLADLGHEVVEATPPLEREAWLDTFVKIVAAETAVDIERTARLVGRKLGLGDFETATWVIGSLGRSFSAADYAGAARYAQRWSRQVGAFFSDYDVLLTPTLAQPPPLHGALQPTPVESALLQAIGRLDAGWFMRVTGLARELLKKPLSFIPYTPLFNVTGQPAISLPLHWNASGLPIGMQFVARMGDEATLFRLAGQLEQARPWFDRAPAGY
jgi:amidase